MRFAIVAALFCALILGLGYTYSQPGRQDLFCAPEARKFALN
jgi:hypothetical protein